MHVCWGNYEGPHHYDVPLADVIDLVFKARAERDLVRGREPAPRARMDAVRDREAARRQGADPGRDRVEVELHRASGTDRAAHRALCEAGRARERHGGQRLRLRHLGRAGGGRPDVVWAKLAALAEGASACSSSTSSTGPRSSSTTSSSRASATSSIDLAAELPLQAIAEIMGVPAGGPPQALRLVEPHDRHRRPRVRGRRRHARGRGRALHVRQRAWPKKRQTDPRDDIVTTLHQRRDRRRHALRDRVRHVLLLLTVAGNETTRNATSHGMRALMRATPTSTSKLRRRPRRMLDGAIEEILRWATPVMHFRRTATARHRAPRPSRSRRATRSSSGTSRPTATRASSTTRSRSTSTRVAERAHRLRRRRRPLLPRRQPGPHGDAT